jgi:hypothetical protein
MTDLPPAQPCGLVQLRVECPRFAGRTELSTLNSHLSTSFFSYRFPVSMSSIRNIEEAIEKGKKILAESK